MPLTFDVANALPFLPSDWLSARLESLSRAQNMLETGQGPGGEYTGWVSLPETFSKTVLTEIKAAAARIRQQSEVLVVVGIGGSYLGARAVLELITSPNYNLIARDTPQVFFAGQTLSPDALNELLTLLEGKDFSINVISKSGTTMETSAAFLLLQDLLEARYGTDGARQRIFITTDTHEGPLRETALSMGYEVFPLPGNIGGRYSVLTAVGLLPLAACGIDIDALLSGALELRHQLKQPGPDNPAWQYAAARHALYQSGKQIELLVSYEPVFRQLGEWWKQLFGESEGKEGRGLFPSTAEFSADLHSMGQYIQEGPRHLFETVVWFEACQGPCPLPARAQEDGLSFLQGQDLHHVARQAFLGTLCAHVDGGVPNLLLCLPDRSAVSVGGLLYFFQYSCALSAYLLDVNPFDQPGVEAYKRNIQALLGKPGLETLRKTLTSRFS